MIRFVFLVDPFTVLGVRLSEPPVVIMPLNLLDARSALTLKVLAHKVLEWAVILENLLLTRLLIRADSKEL
jgi:hypothetical protein